MTQKEKIEALRDLGYDVNLINGKPTVKGDLKLCGANITSLPDNLVVSGWLDLSDTRIKSLPDNLIVGGWLDLTGSMIASLPDNLIVGGFLSLRNTKIKSLPENLTVNEYLYLNGTKIKSLPDNLIVGAGVVFDGNNVVFVNQNVNVDFVQKIWGDKPYCKVDGIFTEVVKRRGKVWEVRKIGETETFYLVNDGNGNYAHGRTIKEAKADLIYKISKKDKSDYKGLTLESTLTHDEAIQCYRVITGACSFGTRNFVENILPPDKRKKQYTIAEMIRLTKGQYGNKTFAEFFENKK